MMSGQTITEKDTPTIERSYFNSLKGLLIILVVIGHFGQTISNLLPGTMGNVGHGVSHTVHIFISYAAIYVCFRVLIKELGKKKR